MGTNLLGINRPALQTAAVTDAQPHGRQQKCQSDVGIDAASPFLACVTLDIPAGLMYLTQRRPTYFGRWTHNL